jgi:hypothetical protein
MIPHFAGNLLPVRNSNGAEDLRHLPHWRLD